jgi:hypothetical protein
MRTHSCDAWNSPGAWRTAVPNRISVSYGSDINILSQDSRGREPELLSKCGEASPDTCPESVLFLDKPGTAGCFPRVFVSAAADPSGSGTDPHSDGLAGVALGPIPASRGLPLMELPEAWRQNVIVRCRIPRLR